MRIVVVRRIAQVFFLLLFVWFCVVATFGEKFWQLRGWPVNWFLELDPLVAIANLLSTHTLYRGLVWALVTVVLTVIVGRFFCGWVCPFGTLHQFFGWLGLRGTKLGHKIKANEYRKGQVIKYYLLVLFLVMAALPMGSSPSLQTGLLDPIPLIYRSVNLVLLPAAESIYGKSLAAVPRQYDGAWIIGTVFLVAILLNFVIPRFFCRFVCPAGALMGLLSRFAIWRIGQQAEGCTECDLCEMACEGACEPGEKMRISECVLCFNCIDSRCRRNLIAYGTRESTAGEYTGPDMGRRGVLAAIGASALAVPLIRLNGAIGTNYSSRVIRPPGSLAEPEFLQRCLKCGQCMRICPTNVIVPGGLDGGLENLWTPVLNFRIGTSGCQLNCTACGHICPTAAIRPITLEEKLGTGPFAPAGPIRLGTAFVDRGRCLPWAMDTPCIVCQENCPVTPKAIFVREIFSPIRFGSYKVAKASGGSIEVAGTAMRAGQYATGDYYLAPEGVEQAGRLHITANTANGFSVEGEGTFGEGDPVQVLVRLQAPVVDIKQCIGCGVCEHECPVSGLRAIRVSAENESRNTRNSLSLERSSQ